MAADVMIKCERIFPAPLFSYFASCCAAPISPSAAKKYSPVCEEGPCPVSCSNAATLIFASDVLSSFASPRFRNTSHIRQLDKRPQAYAQNVNELRMDRLNRRRRFGGYSGVSGGAGGPVLQSRGHL